MFLKPCGDGNGYICILSSWTHELGKKGVDCMITWLAAMALSAVAFGYADLERKGLRKHLAHHYATNSRPVPVTSHYRNEWSSDQVTTGVAKCIKLAATSEEIHFYTFW